MEFYNKKLDAELALQSEYLEDRRKYQDDFNQFVLKNIPDAKDSEGHDPYGIRTYRFAFANYDDAVVLKDLCESEGYQVQIIEPAKGTVISKGCKCFEVRLNPFISMKDFKQKRLN